jgi:hypothetical protein
MFHRSAKIHHSFAMLSTNKQKQSKTENLGNIKPNTPIKKVDKIKKNADPQYSQLPVDGARGSVVG